MTWRAAAAVLLLLGAPAALARVLSYAPYSESMASRGHHEVDTRHFLVIEGEPPGIRYPIAYTHAQVVLHDSAGIDEPRVIFPASGTAWIRTAALYQEHPGDVPVVLVLEYFGAYVSSDAGNTWRKVEGVSFFDFPLHGERPGFGGPFTRGLAAPVQIGSADYPFILGYSGSVVAVATDGSTRTLAHQQARLLGRNREGTRFLIASGFFVLHPGDVSIVDLDGQVTPVTENVEVEAGWITRDGRVYLLSPLTGRSAVGLSVYSNRTKVFERSAERLFAIPTHDYEGAWIVERYTDRTVLSHFSDQTGLRMSWSDPAAPPVEALYPGASGQTLLIQLGHARSATSRTVALALWRTGALLPPAEYDDLFGRIGPGKGFAHVDPDTVAGGSPFAFDMNFFGEFTTTFGSLGQPAAASGADIGQEWGVVRGSLVQRLVLPMVTRVSGAYGSEWRTDVTIFNPLKAKQDVTVRFGAEEKTLTLEPREIRVVEDVLGTLFAVTHGAGPLHVAPKKAVTVTSRTYTRSGEGFGMDAIDEVHAATPRYPYAFAAAFPAENFRTNLFLYEVSGRGSEATLHGFETHERVGVEANETRQFGGIDAWLGTRGGLFIEPLKGGILSTVVAIDNRTNDATYFPPDVAMHEYFGRIVPLIAHVDYPDGSKLRSDLYVFNPSPLRSAFALDVLEQWPYEKGFALAPFEATVIHDPLKTLIGAEGMRTLVVNAGIDAKVGQTPGVRITSRLYRIDPDGGTRGMLVPPLNSFQYATAGETLELIGRTGERLRMTVGLIHADAVSSRARLHAFDDRGNKIAERDVEVVRGTPSLIDDLAGSHRSEAARVVVEVVSGTVGAFGMLTDSVTKDMTWLSANRGGSVD